MFRWYQNAATCYTLLSDIPEPDTTDPQLYKSTWEAAFRQSRWFNQGWTLQELITSTSIECYSSAHRWLGDKESLE